MRLIPRSLFARTACLIAALLLLSQLGTYVFFGVHRPSSRGPVEEALSSTLSMALFALENTRPEHRAALLARLEREGTVRFMHQPRPLPVLFLAENQLDQVLVQALQRAFKPGDIAAIYLDRNHPRDRVWIRLPPRYGFDWLYLKRPPPPRFLPGPYSHYEKTAMLILLSICGSLLIAGHINRPLQELAEAAGDLSRGRIPAPVPERGPDELRAVINTFNHTTATLKQIDEDRSVMLAGISHDLRTPLTRMRLCVELLPEQTDEAIRRRFLKDLAEITDIVDQFSSYVGGAELELQSGIDLGALLHDALEGLQRPGIRLDLQAGECPPLTADRTALRRALVNLVENSIKYGADCVTVHCGADKEWIRISVRDNGPGIPAQEVQRLLRPFTRLDHSRNRVSGSGLGLAIVLRIALLHKGTLQLHSPADGGLEAVLSLPA